MTYQDTAILNDICSSHRVTGDSVVTNGGTKTTDCLKTEATMTDDLLLCIVAMLIYHVFVNDTTLTDILFMCLHVVL